MTLNSNAKFKEKLTCGFKYDMRNLVNFHPTNQESENFFSLGSFCSKYTRFELQKYRGVIFMVSKMAWGIGPIFIRAL